jgi:hypothetical protein
MLEKMEFEKRKKSWKIFKNWEQEERKKWLRSLSIKEAWIIFDKLWKLAQFQIQDSDSHLKAVIAWRKKMNRIQNGHS